MNFSYELIPLQSELLDEVSEYIEQHEKASIYCKPQWLQLIADTYSYKPFYIVRRKGGKIVFLLPVLELNTLLKGLRYTSLPFSHVVEPLYDESFDAFEFVEYLYDEFIIQRGGRLELRSVLSFEDQRLVQFQGNMISDLDLTSTLENLYSGLSKGHRRHLKRAQSSNLSLVEVDDIGGYEVFYELELETRRRQGAPPYSKLFFQEMYLRMHCDGMSRCYLVRSGDRYIAGMIVLLSGECAIYGYGGSLSDEAALAKRPNYYLFWMVIKLLREEGVKVLDFGSSPIGHDGLIQFKNGWGAETRPLAYSFLSDGMKSRSFDRQGVLFRLVSVLLSKLPLCVLARIGPLLLRQMG